MADYISREVARERLRKTCKAGTLVSVLILLIGLAYAAVTAIVALSIEIPEIVSTVMHTAVPSMDNRVQALPECASKGALFILMGFVGLLMFRKMAKTGDAFRLGQMRQLRFIALLAILLGFVPTLAINITAVVLAIRSGASPLAAIAFDIDLMCIISGLLMFMAVRVLASHAALDTQEEELARTAPEVFESHEPSFVDVPDLSNVPTAQDGTSASDSSFSSF